jgi:hypothetical protein
MRKERLVKKRNIIGTEFLCKLEFSTRLYHYKKNRPSLRVHPTLGMRCCVQLDLGMVILVPHIRWE